MQQRCYQQLRNPPGNFEKEVTSPGGTTEAGLSVLAEHGVEQAFINCINEAQLNPSDLVKPLVRKWKVKSLNGKGYLLKHCCFSMKKKLIDFVFTTK